jgi:hypothetical protein
MSWPRRGLLLLAIVVPVVLTATLLHRARLRQMAAEEALIAEAKRQLEALREVQAQADELQRQKADYEGRIAAITRLRAMPSPKTLMEVAKTAGSLGLVIEEMAVAEMTLTVAFRAPAPEIAERFGRDLADRALVSSVAVQRREGDAYSIRGVLLPRSDSPPRPRPQP